MATWFLLRTKLASKTCLIKTKKSNRIWAMNLVMKNNNLKLNMQN